MKSTKEFSFGDSSVAVAYDTHLVPFLFEPWAEQLINEYTGRWTGKYVLDLAAGTGVVTEKLVPLIKPNGKVFALDMNEEMLALAKKRCPGDDPDISFIHSTANAMAIGDNEVDVVISQQGFQFFPDKAIAVQEMYRVLNMWGKVILSTWRPVAECQFFGAVCEALEMMGENEISHSMRMPFDFLPEEELRDLFVEGGFRDVQVTQQSQDLIIEGGIDGAIELAYATPIGPALRLMTDKRQQTFRETLTRLLTEIHPDPNNLGKMVANILTAQK